MKNDKPDDPKYPNVSDSSSKKPYTKPELITYGTVEKLTENSQGPGDVQDWNPRILATRSK